MKPETIAHALFELWTTVNSHVAERMLNDMLLMQQGYLAVHGDTNVSCGLFSSALMVAARSTADCQDAHFRPKTYAFSAENEKIRLKTKLTENSQNPNFRRRKRKQNAVGLY